MRFSAIHKASSYLMVASAFLPLALSGELPTGLILFTLLAGTASFWIEPSRLRLARTRGWAIAWNVQTILFCAWRVGEWLRGEALVISGVHFLCFLLVNKLWNRRASKDYLQAYVVSFLMLVAGTTLNTGLVYALSFIAYVVFATWTLTLFHLRREMEENYLLKHSDDAQSERVEVERILNSRRVVGGQFLAGTALVAAGIFVGSSVIFFLFPRVDFGLFGHRRAGVMTTGFSDRVELGHYGLIKDNPQVVARVEMAEPPRRPLHFRGVAFDTYSQGRWSRSDAAHKPLPRRYNLWLPEAGAAAADLNHTLDRALRQEIYLEPLDVPVLFVAAREYAIQLAPPRPGNLERVERGSAGGLYSLTIDPQGRIVPPQTGRRYTVWSLPEEAADPRGPIERFTDDDLEREERYLQLPRTLPERVRKLAADVTRGADSPRAKADAIARYLKQKYQYSLELGRDERYEPLEDFLFVQRRGHCEYFASAMAILLRAVGVPTRSINGFYGGEWNQYGHYLALRQGDAHSWVDVAVGTHDGQLVWAQYDPTPPIVGGASSSGLFDRLRQIADSVQLAWFKYVIEYDLGKQVDLFLSVRRFFEGAPDVPGASSGPSGPWRWIVAHRRPLGASFAGAIALVLVALRVRRLRRSDGAVRRPGRQAQRAASALAKALRALERRGFARRPSETVAELARRIEQAGDPASVPFGALVVKYYAARFGHAPVDEEALDRLAREVATSEARSRRASP